MKAFWRVWALSRAELIVVFAMGWAASMVPDRASGLTAVVYTIEAGYACGAQNRSTDLSPLGQFFYNLIVTWNNNATQVTALELSFRASGRALRIFLSVCRYLVYWWPLHPIGLVVVSSSTTVLALFPLFQAWLIQTVLVRLGGGRLDRRVPPLFRGVLIACILGQGLSFLVDVLWFHGTPHLFESFWR